MSSDELLYDVADHVALLTFNRPDRMNTISHAMLGALTERLLQADADPNVRAIVITGAGRAWCAGLDVTETAQGGGLGYTLPAAFCPKAVARGCCQGSLVPQRQLSCSIPPAPSPLTKLRISGL